MSKATNSRFNPCILVTFDEVKLRLHMEAAEKTRVPTQRELASAYAAADFVVDLAVRHPATLVDLVEGIALQDTRFVDSGKSVLARLLREQVASSSPKAPVVRRRRSAKANRQPRQLPDRAEITIGPVPVAAPPNTNANAANGSVSPNGFDFDDLGAEKYGG